MGVRRGFKKEAVEAGGVSHGRSFRAMGISRDGPAFDKMLLKPEPDREVEARVELIRGL